jgi:hypothetical protein
MLTGNELYVILKFTSGELIMATLQEEDEQNIMIDYPIVIKTIMDYEGGKERVSVSPLCSFTSEHSYVISKNNVLYIKKLHYVFIPHYQRIVKDQQETTSFSSLDSNSDDSLEWDDEPTTQEESINMQEMLTSIEELDDDIDWDEKLKNLVPGNDTLN